VTFPTPFPGDGIPWDYNITALPKSPRECWNYDPITEGFQLNMGKFVAEAVEKMRNLEDKLTKDLVIQELRNQGYTIEEPK
jgi:hypothetical protein